MALTILFFFLSFCRSDNSNTKVSNHLFLRDKLLSESQQCNIYKTRGPMHEIRFGKNNLLVDIISCKGIDHDTQQVSIILAYIRCLPFTIMYYSNEILKVCLKAKFCTL